MQKRREQALRTRGKVLYGEVRGGEEKLSTGRPRGDTREDDGVWHTAARKAEGEEDVRPHGEPVQEVFRHGRKDERCHGHEPSDSSRTTAGQHGLPHRICGFEK